MTPCCHCLLPVSAGLAELPALHLDGEQTHGRLTGPADSARRVDDRGQLQSTPDDGRLLALAKPWPESARIVRGFNLPPTDCNLQPTMTILLS